MGKRQAVSVLNKEVNEWTSEIFDDDKYNNRSEYIGVRNDEQIKTSYGHAIALWKKRCGINQKRLII